MEIEEWGQGSRRDSIRVIKIKKTWFLDGVQRCACVCARACVHACMCVCVCVREGCIEIPETQGKRQMDQGTSC